MVPFSLSPSSVTRKKTMITMIGNFSRLSFGLSERPSFYLLCNLVLICCVYTRPGVLTQRKHRSGLLLQFTFTDTWKFQKHFFFCFNSTRSRCCLFIAILVALTGNELSRVILSYFGNVKNYLLIDRNLKMISC